MNENSAPASILLIEDDKGLAQSLDKALTSVGFSVAVAPDGIAGIRAAQEKRFDVIVTDMRMPGADGLAVIEALRRKLPDTPIILATAYSTPENAIVASRLGAFEYLNKPLDVEELIKVIQSALDVSRTPEAAQPTIQVADAETQPKTLIGSSRAMSDVYKSIGRYADSSVSVLIQGETGVGKELVSRALHQYSRRKNGPFVPINCAALPENLLESELFGYEKGAFTGADASRAGCFEQAQDGTLFLDEIGDIPLSTQAKLLRALQERAVRRIGSSHERPVNARIIAATHRDLQSMVAEGRFREDLFYRLNAAQIRIPPLRERREDIVELARNAFRHRSKELGIHFSGMQEEALAALTRHDWPGNARQIENFVTKALIRSRGYAITEELIRRLLAEESANPRPTSDSLAQLVSDVLDEAANKADGDAYAQCISTLERELLSQALSRSGDNLAQAARWLGLSRLTLRRKLAALNLR